MIPAHGSAIVEITYVSTKKAFKQMGETPCGYILGHVTIDTQVKNIHCSDNRYHCMYTHVHVESSSHNTSIRL